MIEKKEDPRFPYTYAADLIRMTAGYDKDGTKISRGDASAIRQLIAKILGFDDWVVADLLAIYYLENHDSLIDRATTDFQRASEERDY